MNEDPGRSKWEIHLRKRKCLRCDIPLHRFRMPHSMGQALCDGWTCEQCGAEID